MGYSVKKFNFKDDADKMFSLWKKVLKKPGRKRLHALYSDVSRETSSWMIFCNDDNDPVGSQSVFPLMLPSRKFAAMFGMNCDMIMAKEHRTLGPAVMLTRALVCGAEKLGYDVLLAMPNEMSKPVFKRVGYRKVGDAVRFSKILRSRKKVSQIVENIFVAWILSFIIDFIQRLVTFNYLVRMLYWPKKQAIHEEDAPMNDQKVVEVLCDRGLSRDNANILYWRYGEIGSNDSRIFIIQDKRLKRSLYIIYYIQGSNAIIERIDSFTEGLAGLLLLSRFIDKMYKDGIETIQLIYWGPRKFHKFLSCYGFVRNQGREVFSIFLNKELESISSEIESFQWFDGDLDL